MTTDISKDKDKILILWTGGDRDVALKMVFMYARNAKRNNWWKRVRLVIWGPSAKLASEDKEIQAYIVNMSKIGIELYACISCANMYGVTPDLEKLGVKVIGMGEPLTNMLKDGWTVLSL